MSLPKNASRQVPDWRRNHQSRNVDRIPKVARDRQMDRDLESVYRRLRSAWAEREEGDLW